MKKPNKFYTEKKQIKSIVAEILYSQKKYINI